MAFTSTEHIKTTPIPADTVRHITLADVGEALGKGVSDFWDKPSHYLFLVLIYPIVGIVLTVWTTGGDLFRLLYPLATGFALLGPLAGLGLYEISRRREQSLESHGAYAFLVLRSPALGSIVVLGLMLAACFVLWLMAANALYLFYFRTDPPATLIALVGETLTTPRGWGLLMWGNLAGFCFALFVLLTTVIAFPLLLDRGGSAWRGIETSIRAFTASPLQFLAWGLVVAVLLFVGSLPFFVGLAIVLPVLGHATWHLYRKAVV
ncbi:DUF2189 domain-containing protein [Pelagibacterium sediminicola]|uniref:DUF2189 domain-containing protein n=1 Tax=Pelagibacterium sediminicola TaxID=2248761 RepID=UPI000E3172A1|nr:DUF2189 domain-containing protein [Pelagibacterium sediminicola]